MSRHEVRTLTTFICMQQYLSTFYEISSRLNKSIMDQPVQGFFQQLKLTTYNHGQEYHFFDGLYALEIDDKPLSSNAFCM